MVCGRKIRLLVWKSWLLRKRHYVITGFEIFLPILFAIAICVTVSQLKTKMGAGKNYENSPQNPGQDPDFTIVPQKIKPEEPDGTYKMKCDSFGSTCIFAYAPMNPEKENIINLLALKSPREIEWKGFTSESEIEKHANVNDASKDGGIKAAVIFETGLDAKVISYKIRILQEEKIFSKTTMVSLFHPEGETDPLNGRDDKREYMTSVFAALQWELDKVLIEKLTQKKPTHTLSYQAFPYPSDKELPKDFLSDFLSHLIIIGFVFIVPNVIRNAVSERETGIKELLKMSGIPNYMQFCASMIITMLFLSISVSLVVFLLFIGGKDKGVIIYSDPTIWWVVLFFYLMASTAFLIFVSSFFKKPAIAITVGIILWIVTYYAPSIPLTKFNTYVTLSLGEKLSAALLPNMGFAWAFSVMNLFERREIGAQWSNLFEPLSTADSLSLGWILIMFIIDTFVYFLLTMYVEAVLPNQFGVRKPWYFIFEESIQSCISGVKKLKNRPINKSQPTVNIIVEAEVASPDPDKQLEPQDVAKVDGVEEENAHLDTLPETVPTTVEPVIAPPVESSIVKVEEDLPPGIEAEPEGLYAGVEIKNLEKKFDRNKVAVDGVSMKMYEGEIFALLGHNGAGKTTTISCCIGMMAPSNGTAVINGFDVRNKLGEVRQSIGLCPQHNLLFDELTVDEHLRFFGRLKGINSKAAKNERCEILEKLQLSDKATTLSKSLSGGQKRKLSLGISLIGNSRVIFLDEPTSGMDVEARRAIWDLLLFERAQRTICLTTHFMEEADVLGDRIGIMSHGKLQCCGTSTFLKKYYGTGYTLSLSTTGEGNHDKILSVVQSHVSTASKDSANNNQICILLPTESCPTGVFPSLFKELQSKKDALGIQSIGLSATTMDEVFVKAEGTFLYKSEVETKVNDLTDLTSPSEYSAMCKKDGATISDNSQAANNIPLETKKAGEDAAIEPQTEETVAATDIGLNNAIIEPDENNYGRQYTPHRTGFNLFIQQFLGLIIKRMKYSYRKWGLLVAQVAVPILLLICTIIITNLLLPSTDPPPELKIDIKMYSDAITLYSPKDPKLGKSFASIVGSSASEFNDKDKIGLVFGLLKIGQTDLASYKQKYIVASELTKSNIKAMYSTTAIHSVPLAINFATNTLLDSMGAGKTISVTNHPLEEKNIKNLVSDVDKTKRSLPVIVATLVPIGLALLAASFVVLPIEEKLCKGKQLQMMTGVNPILYWGTSFLFDMFVMSIVIMLMLCCFVIFQKAEAYTSYHGAGVIFLFLFVYGFCAIPLSYLWSLFARTVAGGYSFIVIIHLLTGLLLFFIILHLEGFFPNSAVVSVLIFIGRIFPTFIVSRATALYIELAIQNGKCSFLPDYAEDTLCVAKSQSDYDEKIVQCCKNCLKLSSNVDNCFKKIPYLSWTYTRNDGRGIAEVAGVGQEVLYLFILGVLYQILLILFEYGFKKIAGKVSQTTGTEFSKYPEDEDVINESMRVNYLVSGGQTYQNEDALLVQNFCKSYGPFAAVSNLSFGVHHGECFGLLGVNGAGKTTTFRMLTGDETRSDGNAYAMMCNMDKDRKQFLANMGFCPQFDGIIPVLTGREMVDLFGRLRGVLSVKAETDKWLEKVGLTQSGNVQCGKYSGGMKRRLSAATAMVGDPQLLLLDEPTSGVDPISRREFWKIISSIRESGRAVILTSHSMDEITACCSRLGIMVNGQLQCLGSVPYLKNKFAQGYSLLIKLKPMLSEDTSSQIINLDKDIVIKFTPCFLKDKHLTSLQYEISSTTLPWDYLFQTMEDLKTQFAEVIEDYSITETTLEEVFLSFARQQYPERKVNASAFSKCLQCCC